MRVSICIVCVTLAFAAERVGQLRADMILQGELSGANMQTTNSIYYSNPDRNFSWPQYNWTGSSVYTSGGSWVTMISPSYFITSNHFPTGGGNEVGFFPTGLASGGYIAYTASSWSLTLGDMRLGKLTTPVDSRIAKYPILVESSLQNYVGLNILVEGRLAKVGTSTINYTGTSWPGSYFTYGFDLTGASGASSCLLQPGDSGGPSFAVANGQLALVGIHWSSTLTVQPGAYSADDLAAGYIDSIQNAVQAGGESIQIVVPEPTMLSLLALGGLVILKRRK